MNDRSTSRALYALGFAFFAMGTANLSVIGGLESISASMGQTRSAIAMLIPAFTVTFAIGAPLIQLVLGHWPRRRLLLWGLFTLMVGSLGSAFAPNYALLIVARVITGVGAAAISPIVSSLAASLVPTARQGHALAVVFAGITLASVVGVPLSSWCAATLGWRLMFGVITLLALAAAVALTYLVKDHSHGNRVQFADLYRVLTHRPTSLGLAVTVLGMTSLFTTYTMITPILHVRFQATPHEISIALFIYGVAGLAGNWVARWLALRWTAHCSVLAALVTLIMGFAILCLAPAWVAVALLAMIPWAIAVDVFAPAQQRRLIEQLPAMKGLVLALNSAALFVGISLGAFVAGHVTQHYGLMVLPVCSIGLALLAALMLRLQRVNSQTSLPLLVSKCPSSLK